MAGGVHIVSRRVVRPESASSMLQEPEIMHLTPWDLRLMTVEYIQKGILLPKPLAGGASLVHDIASSFARALDHFYPLAGHLTVAEDADSVAGDPSIVISLRYNGEGAEFVHAVAPEVTVSDITASLYILSVVWSFFPCNGMLGTDAVLDSHPVLAAQVTELAVGVFVSKSLNHGVVDGTMFWHFLNTWSEINRRGSSEGDHELVATPPVGQMVPRLLPGANPSTLRQAGGHGPAASVLAGAPVLLPFLRDNVRKLKAKANTEMAGTATTTISSLQSLLAHVWRAVCHARHLPPHRETRYMLLVGFRAPVNGIPQGYTSNAVTLAFTISTAGEVKEKGLGWAAWLLNRAVASFDEARVRDGLASWVEEPSFLYEEPPCREEPTLKVVTGSSPRFDVYGNDFGWGQPVAVRSGAARKMDGKATVYQGCGGGGSMGLEVCLSHEVLARLVADEEFMEAVSAE